jgi:Type I restriction-modification system methyltransferase subunit
MLDTDTKRRIDTARDILVGKVPDPKSQVEQITIALIYKFMDDIDAESEELGGDRQFFTGEFAEYGWSRLMSPSVGGHELIRLYDQGISTMPENPGIPVLFRDIFKNAYLPYRDPETLKSFLKIINEFSYDHSEKLGDAFEYLLSVLGSQGDAGQFRTPRHIIDFIVEIIQPKKGEVILDPACGTAGFLISAYKHILRNNRDTNNINTLTPDEKGGLAKNFLGYDISPDMVRLSLVNLYLHGFNDPHIIEYDTLTSEDRWNQFADVILANPPFMSPKGGIKPHKRFSIKAKRSEVLFVDYIAEHLTPKGRAGIIVPEGIIFQSQTAYKDLRKILVENYLVAVVSLPAGVFNPYSNVKTSILILDKSLAKLSDSVAFFKVENDGFGLGAQRREVTGEQLTKVKIELELYLQAVRNQELTDNFELTLGLVVPKVKIAANGDYNFSGERYRESIATNSKFSYVLLRDVSKVITKGTTPTTDGFTFEDSGVNFIKIESVSPEGNFIKSKLAHISQQTHSALSRSQLEVDDVLFSIAGAMGRSAVVDSSLLPANTNQALAIIRLKTDLISPIYLSHLLRSSQILSYVTSIKTGVAQYNLSLQQVGDIKIPLPPIAIQQEIVTEIENYQKVINGARAVIDNYRPHIPINSDWAIVELGEVLTLQRGYDLPKQEWKEGSYPIVGSNGIIGFHNTYKEIGPGVVTGRSGTIGKVHYIDASHYWPHNTSLFVKDFKGNDPKFVLYLLKSVDLKSLGERTAAVPSLDRKNAHRLKVSLPPLEIQKAIVAEIEAEQTLVNANRELITRFEKKIQTTLNRIWGEE